MQSENSRQFTVYSLQFTLFPIPFTLYSLPFTLYSSQVAEVYCNKLLAESEAGVWKKIMCDLCNVFQK